MNMRYRPTVFLVLNKLLLFGTKIVTLFGQRKNVFVKQKHSGQNVKCAVHEKQQFVETRLFCFLLRISLVWTPNLQLGFCLPETNLIVLLKPVWTCHNCSLFECRSPFPLTALDVVWWHPPISHPHNTKFHIFISVSQDLVQWPTRYH